MKTFSGKLVPSILSIGTIIIWFLGLQFIVAESSEVLVRGLAYIISAPFVIFILDYTIE